MSGALLIAGGDVLTPFETIVDGAVLVCDGRIERAGPRSELARARVDTQIDVQGRLILPGFVDLQVNGGGGAFLTEDGSVESVWRMAAAHARFGTTAMLPTIVTSPEATLVRALEAVAVATEASNGGARVLGAHLEGPFISVVRKGAHDERSIVAPDIELLRRLIDTSRGTLRVITVAPELPGALDLIAAARGAGVVVSIGHTDATYEEALRGIEAGASLATHVFNAMRPLAQRDPGVIGALLEHDDVIVDAIADGVHVHPAVLSLVARAKGAGGLALVTDAMPAAGGSTEPARLYGREIVVRDGACYTPEGVLAGSALTMNLAVRNMRRLAGVPLLDAVRMATATPARVLGMEHEIGVLAPGARADIVVCDDDLNVWKTLVGGRLAYDAASSM